MGTTKPRRINRDSATILCDIIDPLIYEDNLDARELMDCLKSEEFRHVLRNDFLVTIGHYEDDITEFTEDVRKSIGSERTNNTMNNAYLFQNRIVVYRLVNNYGYSLEQATELWYTSKTRHVIQEEEKADWASPARCLTELWLELSKDHYWMMDDFEI